jgi:hypothetical protein
MVLLLAAALAAEPGCAKDRDCVLLRYPPEDCCRCGPPAWLAVERRDAARREAHCAAMGACACAPDAPSGQRGTGQELPPASAVCTAGRCEVASQPDAGAKARPTPGPPRSPARKRN